MDELSVRTRAPAGAWRAASLLGVGRSKAGRRPTVTLAAVRLFGLAGQRSRSSRCRGGGFCRANGPSIRPNLQMCAKRGPTPPCAHRGASRRALAKRPNVRSEAGTAKARQRGLSKRSVAAAARSGGKSLAQCWPALDGCSRHPHGTNTCSHGQALRESTLGFVGGRAEQSSAPRDRWRSRPRKHALGTRRVFCSKAELMPAAQSRPQGALCGKAY